MAAADEQMEVQKLRRKMIELAIASDAIIESFVRALDLREGEAQGHTEHVAELAVRLAGSWYSGETDLMPIKHGALLHDIGKMGIPEAILQKPAPLNDEEWGIMRRHPQYAYDLLSPVAYLHQALDIPLYHHEKWNGSGYPHGLQENQIPLAARIFAVVDVWDALTSDRPYRKAWSTEKALEYLRTQAGVHFDPAVMEKFLSLDRA